VSSTMDNKQCGFTLVELMVTLAVATLFLVVAVPGYYSVIQNNKAVTIANSFTSSLNLARNEAIRRGTSVSLCPAANTAYSSCANTTNWANGWIVFVDSDENGVIASAADRLKVQPLLPVGSTITASATFISYESSGFLGQGAGNTNIAAAGCTGNNARQVNLSNNGRISVSRAACP
jgi:type IV fimbrial biogenesis protein FimT